MHVYRPAWLTVSRKRSRRWADYFRNSSGSFAILTAIRPAALAPAGLVLKIDIGERLPPWRRGRKSFRTLGHAVSNCSTFL